MTCKSAVIERIRVGWGGAVAVLLLAWLPAAAAAEPAVVIQGASLSDAASGTMKPDRTIVLSGQKIQAVGTPEQPAAVPKGARILDGKGKFAIPGLIDAHVHLVHRLNYAHMTGDEVLPLFLANGVTTDALRYCDRGTGRRALYMRRASQSRLEWCWTTHPSSPPNWTARQTNDYCARHR